MNDELNTRITPPDVITTGSTQNTPDAPATEEESDGGAPSSITREVRFAIVMYGGVSLAIYINGIAQELLRMVRATASVDTDGKPENRAPIDGNDLNGTERVYRKLSYLLSDDELQEDYIERLKLVDNYRNSPKAQEAGEDTPRENSQSGRWLSDIGEYIASLEKTEKHAGKRLEMLENKVMSDLLEERVKSNWVVPTRFVIDILSGTSAGGINGIFLAKALANGQDIDQLKELWIQEGDIERLINDKKSVETPLSLEDPPPSLLNSKRMYLKLLKAFDGMGKEACGADEAGGSPYVDELDLFVTTTDIQGVPLPIRLADDVVYERRHRNVFHLVYSKSKVSGAARDRNDFTSENNPFLAYAARCTSSFPFAFDPMRLCDADSVLEKLGEYVDDKNCLSGSERWQPFYKDYLGNKGVARPVEFPKRSFGDGGYLDNKPFSYATDTLMRRHADVPVDRKLIYIEPSPEHPEDELESERKPDALENVMAALFTLPRYETIREDLQRVNERNRLIDRVNRIIQGVEKDTDYVVRNRPGQLGALSPLPTDTKELWAKWELTDDEWATLDLADMIKRKGRGYVAYHRLEIAAVTDDIARLVARVAGFDEQSDYFLVVRGLVRAWRDRTYVEYREKPGDKTMNQFLYEFDLAYRLRRINFLRGKIDQLHRLDEQAREYIELRVKGFWEAGTQLDDEEKAKFRRELLRIKRKLNDEYSLLRNQGRILRSRRAKQGSDPNAPAPITHSPVSEEIDLLIKEIGRTITADGKPHPSSAILEYFVGARKDELHGKAKTAKPMDAGQIVEECAGRAKDFLNQHESVADLFDTAAEALRNNLSGVATRSDYECLKMLTSRNTSLDGSTATARECLRHYYQNYDDYDMIIFPMLYDTDVGEADTVEIIRISPEDAKALINERESACCKLAGTALGHFGAFLDESWRKNDILWGRLDGAERIINALLPNHSMARPLIGEAQAAIVLETIKGRGEVETKDLLVESMMRPKSGRADEMALKTLTNFLQTLKQEAGDTGLKQELEPLIPVEKIRDHYNEVFEKRSRLDAEQTLRSAARTTTVTGKILSGISARYEAGSKYAAWVARLGQIFWGLVEVAVPSSMPNLIFRHFLKLLYFFEVTLIIGSTLLVSQPVQQFALTAFGVTIGIHLTVLILGDLMRSRNKWLNILKTLGLVALIGLVVFGVLSLSAVLGVDALWDVMYKVRCWYEDSPPFGWNSKTYARIGVSAFFLAFFLWAIRGDLRALARKTK